jgi:hypothetical protein
MMKSREFLGVASEQVDSQYLLDDFFTKAEKVLAERPE